MELEEFATYHHFVNGKAYTEDDLLVYNVVVCNAPKNTTKGEILEYFKTFGDIVSVTLLNEDQTMCFVNFSNPLSAAKVLQSWYHKLNKKNIRVSACVSWHQPDAQLPAAMATAGDDTTTNDALILTLNDDCLDVIFKNLKLKDQVNLARCCSHLKDVFAMRAKVEYKILNLKKLEFLTLWQKRQFVQMAGSQIKKLELRGPHKYFKHIIAFLGIYCTSVKSVRITSNELTANDLRKLLKNMSMVEELRLKRTYLKDDCILVLKELKNLKILSLEGNYYLTGENIKDLATVESLSLNGCAEIESISFTQICENLKDLKCLDIQNCSDIKLSAIQDIVKYLHKLETLKLYCDNDQVECVATLPNLKHIFLKSLRGFVKSEFFVELAKHRSEQLESLVVSGYNLIKAENISVIGELRQLKGLMLANNDDIDDNCLNKIAQLQELELLNIHDCKGFSGKGLLDFIEKCPKLNKLNVSNCKQLNQEFATKVLELFKSEKTGKDERKVLKIIALGSEIPKFAVNTPAFESATELLPISIEYEMDNFPDSESDTEDYVYDLDPCTGCQDLEFFYPYGD